MRRLVLFLALVIAGCPKPSDGTPQIAVTPGAANRINLIGSHAKPPKAKTPARVHPLKAGEELGGPNATGRVGDWVIENDEVVFVIDGLGGGGGFAESGGNLIDAADAKTRKDELGQLFTYFGAFPRQGVYTKIDARTEPDGTAIVESRGKELYEANVDVVTQFRLGGSDRALLLRTTLTNNGTSKVEKLGLGDAIQWGGAEKFAPGQKVGFRGKSKGPYVGGIGRYTSYAITSTEGEIAAISGGAWTDTEQKLDVVLEPKASITYERVFLVGERPDAASVVAELTKAAGGEVGAIDVTLTDANGKTVVVPVGAKIVIGTQTEDLLSLVATKSGESFGGEVPPGKWFASYAPSAGRRGDGKKIPVEVKKGEVARAVFTVSEPAEVTLPGCVEVPATKSDPNALAVPSRTRIPIYQDGGKTDAIPCKITIEGLSGTPTPELGPAHVSGPAKNHVTLAPKERVTIPLPHGRYRLTASRGPEYDLTSIELNLPGEVKPFELRRVVDTPGYVSTDFHQHTILSADAPVATRDRVIANAAEGLEVAVASEHNVVADLTPIAKETGLAPFLVQIAGDELTSDASKKPWGHANVFPLVPHADKPRGGAFAVRDRSAKDIFAEARALAGGPRVLQINHPRSGLNGYFDQLGFDRKTGVGTDPGYDSVFDAIEVWNGRTVQHRAKVTEDFFALLRTGHPATPIADTDTHGIVGSEPGYPRTYVRVTKDDVLEAWDEARTADLVKTIRSGRDVVLTNGPFLDVTANGARAGAIARGKKVTVKLSVTSAPWVVVEKAELRLATEAKAPPPITLTPKPNAKGALVATATFDVQVAADDALVAFVSGTKAMRPVLSGEDAEIAPFAMSAPIWIDADGDGKALNR